MFRGFARRTISFPGCLVVWAAVPLSLAQQPVIVANAVQQAVPVYVVEPPYEPDFDKYVRANSGHVVVSSQMTPLTLDLPAGHFELTPLIRSRLDSSSAPRAFAALLAFSGAAGQSATISFTLDFAELKALTESLSAALGATALPVPTGANVSGVRMASKTGLLLDFSNDLTGVTFAAANAPPDSRAGTRGDPDGLGKLAELFKTTVRTLRGAGAQ